eukprot:6206078-Pleurochrysis_carterae.AAC.1
MYRHRLHARAWAQLWRQTSRKRFDACRNRCKYRSGCERFWAGAGEAQDGLMHLALKMHETLHKVFIACSCDLRLILRSSEISSCVVGESHATDHIRTSKELATRTFLSRGNEARIIFSQATLPKPRGFFAVPRTSPRCSDWTHAKFAPCSECTQRAHALRNKTTRHASPPSPKWRLPALHHPSSPQADARTVCDSVASPGATRAAAAAAARSSPPPRPPSPPPAAVGAAATERTAANRKRGRGRGGGRGGGQVCGPSVVRLLA